MMFNGRTHIWRRLSVGTVAGMVIALISCEQQPGNTQPPAAEKPADHPTEVDAPDVDPAPLPAALQQIVALIGRGSFVAAQSEINAWRKAHPDDGRGDFIAGLVLHKQRRYADAEPLFAEAIRRAPAYPLIHYYHGWCLYYLGEMERARVAFENHLEFDPASHDSHYALGLIDLEAGALEDAEREFREAIALLGAQNERDPTRADARLPDLAKCYARLGDVLLARGELAEARAALERSIALYPLHVPAYYTLSTACRRLGDDEAADAALARHEMIKSRIEQSRSAPE